MGSTTTAAPRPIRGAGIVDTAGTLGRLLCIEARRTVAIWLVPLMAWLAWRIVRDALALDVVLWVEASAAIGRSAVVVGPLAAGAAAWVAGRDRRRNTGDLLGTTARPAFQRDLAVWAGTTAWGLAAYGAVAAVVLVETARRATWGGPAVWPILAGAAGVAAHVAVGTALGRLNLGRFGNLMVAPVAVMGLFYAQILSSDTRLEEIGEGWSRGRLLSLDERWQTSVWYGLPAALPALQAVWYLGLTGAILAAVAVARRRGVLEALALAVAVAVALTSAAEVVQRTGSWGQMVGVDRTAEATPVALSCAGEPFEVCVHPAYRAWRDDIAGSVNAALAPLVGLPGAPTRAEQVPDRGERPPLDGSVPFRQLQAAVYGGEPAHEIYYWGSAVAEIVRGAVDGTCSFEVPPDDPTRLCSLSEDEQRALALTRQAVAQGLLQREGGAPMFAHWGNACANISPGDYAGAEAELAACQASGRFAALSAEDQRAWLAANYAALRAGTLALDDLP